MPIYKDEKRGTYYFITRINGKQVKRRGFKSPKEAKLAEAQLLLDA
ncbi:Arm DNA-binding domain-containing protein, partial [Gracilibacillus dipsosauri]